jgi:uncharacterized membrane protein
MLTSNWSNTGASKQSSVRTLVNNFLTYMKSHPLTEVATAATPPTAITGLQLAGVPLSEVVLILNCIYIALGIIYLIYKMVRKDKDNGSE